MIIRISSNTSGGDCQLCEERLPFSSSDNEDIQVNHYINEHGFQLIHCGAETSHSDSNELWHSTVYVLESKPEPENEA